jgi:hypothetical protein
VDADPADNTDVCYVDHSEGSRSTGLTVNDGWFMFPFDDGSNQYSAEGPMHCRKSLEESLTQMMTQILTPFT